MGLELAEAGKTVTLDQLRAEYARQRFLAMPIAGAIGWSAVGILGAVLPRQWMPLALFVCVGMIFWLGVLVGQALGEPIMKRGREQGELDRLFLLCVLMANLVWAIAIPFFLVEPTSLPLSVGVLAGLMWLPFSWMIRHWVGIFHGVARTVLVLIAWHVFPEHRFTVVPAVIVAIYLVSIFVLARRPRPRLATQSA